MNTITTILLCFLPCLFFLLAYLYACARVQFYKERLLEANERTARLEATIRTAIQTVQDFRKSKHAYVSGSPTGLCAQCGFQWTDERHNGWRYEHPST